MNELVRHNSLETGESVSAVTNLTQTIDKLLDRIESSGLNIDRWHDEYADLPNEVEALSGFLRRLEAFQNKRQEALATYEFGADMSEAEKEKIKHFDQEVMMLLHSPELRLGNGGTAEVYSMMSNDTLCVKFITNQANYDVNNHMRVEYHFLERLYAATKNSTVRVPYPVFLRIHAREGHSYGMEKIKGANLSQMLEFHELYPDVLEIARGLDRGKAEADLVSFIEEMHEAGVVHCDLYMRNIMLGLDGRLYVIDFGKSKNIDFKGEKEDEKKSDLYNARVQLREFFTKLDKLTEAKNSI